MDEEGTEVIIRKIIGDIGIHKTYMNTYDKLMNMSKKRKMGDTLYTFKKY